VPVFSVTYAEPKGGFGAHSALSFPNFFPKFAAGSASWPWRNRLRHQSFTHQQSRMVAVACSAPKLPDLPFRYVLPVPSRYSSRFQ